MCNSESLQNEESKAYSVDSLKACFKHRT